MTPAERGPCSSSALGVFGPHSTFPTLVTTSPRLGWLGVRANTHIHTAALRSYQALLHPSLNYLCRLPTLRSPARPSARIVWCVCLASLSPPHTSYLQGDSQLFVRNSI